MEVVIKETSMDVEGLQGGGLVCGWMSVDEIQVERARESGTVDLVG